MQYDTIKCIITMQNSESNRNYLEQTNIPGWRDKRKHEKNAKKEF